ncbi:MAG TPA: YqgE/AlgH family protein [Actinomycetota bacterium]|nr:YqgE/AlgH family protein [Actinomycetota bacterium]
MDSLRGSLLIAAGQLLDPNFRRCVVLIAEHEEHGALGLVLNRPAEIPVSEVAPPLGPFVPDEAPIFLGGPVQKEAVVILADYADPGDCERPIFDQVGFASPDDADDPLSGIRRARVFAGYAGWGPGQLESELAEDAWIIEPAQPDDVFTEEPARLWATVLRRKGGDYKMLSLMPSDLSTN